MKYFCRLAGLSIFIIYVIFCYNVSAENMPFSVFYDDFTGYSEQNSAYGVSNIITSYRNSGTEKIIAANPITKAKWILSKYWAGDTSVSLPGGAYVDPISQKLAVRDGGYKGTAVNLDLGSIDTSGICEIQFELSTNKSMAMGLNLFISSDDKTFYSFGINGSNAAYVYGGIVNTPYIVKYSAGTPSVITPTETSSFSHDTGFAQCSIKLNGDSITFTVKNTVSNWTYTIKDSQQLNIKTSYKYLCGAFCVGSASTDGTGYITNINLLVNKDITYTETTYTKTFLDDFSSYTSTPYNSAANALAYDGTARVVATHSSGANWCLSAVNIGRSLEAPAYTWIEAANSRLVLTSSQGYPQAVNLDLSPVAGISEIESLSFTVAKNGYAMTGTTMFISSDEKTYYQFGFSGSEGTVYGLSKYTPFVAKIVNNATPSVSSNTLYYDTAAWASGDIPAQWEIQVNGNVLTWTVIGATGKTWSGTLTDSYIAVRSNWKYPMALFARTSWNNTASVSDVNMTYTVKPVTNLNDAENTVEEYFDTYSSYAGVENAITFINGTSQLMATHSSGANWIASGVNVGLFNGNTGKAYFDSATQSIVLSHGTGRLQTVNLELSADANTYDIKELSFDVKKNGYESTGMNMFISRDEKTYYEFAFAGSENYHYGLPEYTPYVAKVVNGTNTKLYNDAVFWWSASDIPANWTIKVDGNLVSWTVTGASGKMWSGSFTDTDATEGSNWQYPCAVAARSSWNNVSAIGNVTFKVKSKKALRYFNEDFTTYTDSDYYGTINNAAVYSAGGTPVASGDGYSWILSENVISYNKQGKAWIDLSNSLGVYDTMVRMTAVNLYFNDEQPKELYSLSFDVARYSSKSSGMNLFISSYENTYYSFGINGSENNYAVGGVANIPYVFTNNGGTITVISPAADLGWTVADTAKVHCDISVSGTVITCLFTTITGKTWTFSFDDSEQLSLINSDYKYLCAAYNRAGGTGKDYALFSNINIICATDMLPRAYNKKVYSNFALQYISDRAVNTGNNEEIKSTMGVNLQNVIVDTGLAKVNVNEDNVLTRDVEELLGVQCEFFSISNDNYDYFYDSDGNLREDYIEYAQTCAPIPSYRFGGTSSDLVNFINTIGTLDERKASEFIVNIDNMNLRPAGVLKMGLVEWMKVAYANNPDASFILCVSYLTTSAEDAGKLAEFLFGDVTTEWGAKRLQYLGRAEPVNVEYFELGNEIACYEEEGYSLNDIQRYIDCSIAMINAIKAVNSSAKFMACGANNMWGGRINYWRNWTYNIAPLLEYVDAMSHHPYYYGHSAEYMMYFARQMKEDCDTIVAQNDFRDENGSLKDIKIVSTEHARYASFDETSTWFSALGTSYFLAMTGKSDYMDGAYYHNIWGHRMWAFHVYADGSFYKSPTEKVYEAYSSAIKDMVVESNVNIFGGSSTNGDGLYSSDLSTLVNVIASKASDDDTALYLVLTNRAPYTNVNVNFSFNNAYTLAEETVVRSANIYTLTYNEACEELTTLVTNQKNIPNFTSYLLPNASVVVLKLLYQAPAGVNTIEDDFDYTNTAELSGQNAPQIVASDSQTNWSTSSVHRGYGTAKVYTSIMSSSTRTYYGSAAVFNNALQIKSCLGNAMVVNYDSGDLIGENNRILQISFDVTNDSYSSGGIRLFISADEATYCEPVSTLTGKVHWVIIIDGTNASWKATANQYTQSGTFEIPNSYKYLLAFYNKAVNNSYTTWIGSSYLTGVGYGAAVFDNLEITYSGNQTISYITDSSGVTVTILPQLYTANEINVWTAFYDDDNKLIQLVMTDIDKSKETQSFTLEKPESYGIGKIFVWDGIALIKPIDKILYIR